VARPRIVIIGGGFAGFHAAKAMRHLAGRAEVVLINPTDYFLYLPLLPEVAAGVLEPRRVCVSLPAQLRHVRLELGTVDRIDLDNHEVGWLDAEGRPASTTYDRLLLAAGSVNKLLPIPGVAENAHGFRGVSEALFLRDHITRQIELAATTSDPDERAARCTFVVVGAGYTGTEVAAQGQLFTTRLALRHPALHDQPVRWLLLDTADRVLPELDRRMSRTANRVLSRRGVEVRTRHSVSRAGAQDVTLDDGELVPTRSLIWCVGVRPDPLVGALALPLQRGRLVVDETLQVPGRPDVYACGDCAAAPDLTRPGQVTAMTAQHAQRQGVRAAHNIIASLDGSGARSYRHHDLGFLVDLGGSQAAANPVGVPLAGWPAKAVARGYHLFALPGNRIRTAVDWTLNATMSPPDVQLGLVGADRVRLDTEQFIPEHRTQPDEGS
jgi:NADH dehydrogenase